MIEYTGGRIVNNGGFKMNIKTDCLDEYLAFVELANSIIDFGVPASRDNPEQWIPMKERLPDWDDFDDRVGSKCYIAKKVWDYENICYKTVVDFAVWTGEHFIHGHGCGCNLPIEDVTHWMPQPKSPKEV